MRSTGSRKCVVDVRAEGLVQLGCWRIRKDVDWLMTRGV